MITVKNELKNGRDSKGRFAEGNSGRPKGAKNKVPAEVRQSIVDFLSEKIEELPELWNDLTPAERVQLIVSCARLTLPRPPIEIGNTKTENLIFTPIDLDVEE